MKYISFENNRATGAEALFAEFCKEIFTLKAPLAGWKTHEGSIAIEDEHGNTEFYPYPDRVETATEMRGTPIARIAGKYGLKSPTITACVARANVFYGYEILSPGTPEGAAFRRIGDSQCATHWSISIPKAERRLYQLGQELLDTPYVLCAGALACDARTWAAGESLMIQSEAVARAGGMLTICSIDQQLIVLGGTKSEREKIRRSAEERGIDVTSKNQIMHLNIFASEVQSRFSDRDEEQERKEKERIQEKVREF